MTNRLAELLEERKLFRSEANTRLTYNTNNSEGTIHFMAYLKLGFSDNSNESWRSYFFILDSRVCMLEEGFMKKPKKKTRKNF